MSDVTLTENVRVSLPASILWSGAGAVAVVVLAAAATYFSVKAQIGSLVQTVSSIERDLGRVVDRVELGPTRREFDLALERLRYLEAKVKE